ncbi:uncharacterized protein LOC113318242 isoform X1 [Papaver somniferum]|uniref:uncharacterized protein LOC113318242 isoform X1 n=1 Tax=Papaver somniferum TaxID=3469 RepID=UPI000E6F91CE|nr:uncharacterized protein LOC113318242 isoform X1 [Papaver somniferum]
MFAQITERGRFLLFLLARVITFERYNQLMFHMVDMWREVNFIFLMLHKIPFTSTIFSPSFIQEHCRNRGKGFELIQRLSNSVVAYEFSFGLSNSCSIVPACMIYTGGNDFILLLTTAQISYKFIVNECLFLIIKFARWIYDRGKLLGNQGYFTFTTSYKCCVVTITYGVTVFLVSKWTAAYGSESVYRADHVLTTLAVGYLTFVMFASLSPCSALDEIFWCFPPWSLVYQPRGSHFHLELYGKMMALQLLLTVIDIPLVFVTSLPWGLILFLMAFWDAGNVRGLCRHSPFVRPHMVFIGVYFSLSRLVNSYCTSAGNAYLQLLKVEGGQVFLHSVIRTSPCYLHYNQPESYGYIHLWSLNSGNFSSLYFVYTCYLFDRGKGFAGYIVMDSSSGPPVYDFDLDHWYQMDLLWATLIMFLFVWLSVEAENSIGSHKLYERHILVLQILSKQREILLAVLPASISNLAADNDAQPNDILERSPGQVALWLTVKDCIGSQFLRARIVKGQLAFLLTSEARFDFATGSIYSMEIVIYLGMILVARELRQLPQKGSKHCTGQGSSTAWKVLGELYFSFSWQGSSTSYSRLLHKELSVTKGVSLYYHSGFDSCIWFNNG